MAGIISLDRSIVPACDVSTVDSLMDLVFETKDIPKVGAYKIGFSPALRYGLPAVVNGMRHHSNKPIIYDHQKGGTDIPGTAKDFASVMKECGVDAAIIFPFAGPVTLKTYVTELQNSGVEPIVGGEMTHKGFLDSEVGYISYTSVVNIYRDAAMLGVTNFVVPGNKPHRIKFYKELLEHEHPDLKPTFFSPGLITQGGKISEAAEVAGERWHAIIGEGIYGAKDIRASVLEYASQL